jgi:hypothetical protein
MPRRDLPRGSVVDVMDAHQPRPGACGDIGGMNGTDPACSEQRKADHDRLPPMNSATLGASAGLWLI